MLVRAKTGAPHRESVFSAIRVRDKSGPIRPISRESVTAESDENIVVLVLPLFSTRNSPLNLATINHP
jgi:hypothetical protein